MMIHFFALLMFVIFSAAFAFKIPHLNNVLKRSAAASILPFLLLTTSTSPSSAIDLDNAEKLFNANCAYCHAGGGNVVPFSSSKTLESKALSENGYKTEESIVQLLVNGKGMMPRFSSFISPKGNVMPAKLDEQQMNDVAKYVFLKAEKGWKN